MPGSLGGQLFGDFAGAPFPSDSDSFRELGLAALMALSAVSGSPPMAATGRASGTVLAGEGSGQRLAAGERQRRPRQADGSI